MAGFVECLDNDEAQEGVEKADGGSDLNMALLVILCRQLTVNHVSLLRLSRR